MNAITPSFSLEDSQRLRAASGASWGAISAGAVVAVSISVVLVILGSGLGFAMLSPWPDHGLSRGSFSVAGAIWLIVTQWLSAAAGGYVAGRLRQRWLATHTHEVFFRDTAHGLVTWSVATLTVVAVLASSAASMVGGATRAAGGLAAAGTGNIPASGPGVHPRGPMSHGAEEAAGAYDLDKLFRSAAPGTVASLTAVPAHARDPHTEAAHIAAQVVTTGDVSSEDRSYLATIVASESGISADQAQKRVDVFVQSMKEATAKAKVVEDEARAAAASAALFTALALLVGAFIASVAAAIGGRLRDEHL